MEVFTILLIIIFVLLLVVLLNITTVKIGGVDFSNEVIIANWKMENGQWVFKLNAQYDPTIHGKRPTLRTALTSELERTVRNKEDPLRLIKYNSLNETDEYMNDLFYTYKILISVCDVQEVNCLFTEGNIIRKVNESAESKYDRYTLPWVDKLSLKVFNCSVDLRPKTYEVLCIPEILCFKNTVFRPKLYDTIVDRTAIISATADKISKFGTYMNKYKISCASGLSIVDRIIQTNGPPRNDVKEFLALLRAYDLLNNQYINYYIYLEEVDNIIQRQYSNNPIINVLCKMAVINFVNIKILGLPKPQPEGYAFGFKLDTVELFPLINPSKTVQVPGVFKSESPVLLKNEHKRPPYKLSLNGRRFWEVQYEELIENIKTIITDSAIDQNDWLNKIVQTTSSQISKNMDEFYSYTHKTTSKAPIGVLSEGEKQAKITEVTAQIKNILYEDVDSNSIQTMVFDRAVAKIFMELSSLKNIRDEIKNYNDKITGKIIDNGLSEKYRAIISSLHLCNTFRIFFIELNAERTVKDRLKILIKYKDLLKKLNLYDPELETVNYTNTYEMVMLSINAVRDVVEEFSGLFEPTAPGFYEARIKRELSSSESNTVIGWYVQNFNLSDNTKTKIISEIDENANKRKRLITTMPKHQSYSDEEESDDDWSDDEKKTGRGPDEIEKIRERVVTDSAQFLVNRGEYESFKDLLLEHYKVCNTLPRRNIIDENNVDDKLKKCVISVNYAEEQITELSEIFGRALDEYKNIYANHIDNNVMCAIYKNLIELISNPSPYMNDFAAFNDNVKLYVGENVDAIVLDLYKIRLGEIKPLIAEISHVRNRAENFARKIPGYLMHIIQHNVKKINEIEGLLNTENSSGVNDFMNIVSDEFSINLTLETSDVRNVLMDKLHLIKNFINYENKNPPPAQYQKYSYGADKRYVKAKIESCEAYHKWRALQMPTRNYDEYLTYNNILPATVLRSLHDLDKCYIREILFVQSIIYAIREQIRTNDIISGVLPLYDNIICSQIQNVINRHNQKLMDLLKGKYFTVYDVKSLSR